MNDKLKNVCDLMADNWLVLQKLYKRENPYLSLAGSSAFTAIGSAADEEKIRECERLLMDRTDKRSELQGSMKIPFICEMAIHEDPEIYLEKVRKIAELLRVFRWLGADYRLFSGMVLADHIPDNIEDETKLRYYLNESGEIFARLKEKFGKALSEKDYPFAVMLAVTDYETEPMMDDVFEGFSEVVKVFKTSASCRSIAYIQASGEEYSKEKRARLIGIMRNLKVAEYKITTGYELGFFAALSSLDMESSEISKVFLETESYLRHEKHFRGYTMKPKIRTAYTALAVWLAYRDRFEESRNLPIYDGISLLLQTEVGIVAEKSSFLSFSSKV